MTSLKQHKTLPIIDKKHKNQLRETSQQNLLQMKLNSL